MTARPGFTLVEVMVSLLIFSLIAAAGVGLLTVSITNREVVAEATAEGASLMRAHRSLKNDLGQALDRPARGLSGDGAGFRAAGTTLALTRGGWQNPSGADRAALQRVEYALVDHRLIRRIRESVDAGPLGPPQILMEDVQGFDIRFVSRGRSFDKWPVDDGQALPDAVDIVLETRRFGRVEMDFAVGGAR